MAGTVIQTATGGRGFVIATEKARYVVTAAHRLPNVPPAHPALAIDELTYRDFLGPLGGPGNVWAACAFVDPVADLAVLCAPDDQALYARADTYHRLTEPATPFSISAHWSSLTGQGVGRPRRSATLGGQWVACRIEGYDRTLWIEAAAPPIEGGMSGSPIVVSDGGAVGVVCTDHGPNPMLLDNLPTWLTHEEFEASVEVEDLDRQGRWH